MGVLNITPDSFSDGGSLHRNGRPDLDKILLRAEQMLIEGAGIVDVGGESTRPGAGAVSVAEELDRVLPVVEAISQRFNIIVSIDTSSPELMRAARGCGAGMINDVRALERPGALLAAQQSGLAICLMHMQGQPKTMQQTPGYEDVVGEVIDYLAGRAAACIAEGVDRSLLVLDPGFGFGKTSQHNLALLNRLPQVVGLGYPVLVGLSRKSLIGDVLGRDVGQRLAGSLALAVLAAERGASIIRVHDVAETVDVIKLREAVIREQLAPE
jgi:dihydropteroate synthase